MAKPLRDVIAPDLDVLFSGINPSIVSATRGHHYARPGNRFWRTLHGAGFTPELFTPDRDGELTRYGIGLTNLVDRPTRAADELTAEEMREGAAALERLVADYRPGVLAMVGLGAWRTGFERPAAKVGLQPERVGGRPVWVLPNPSGLNAHYQLPQLVKLFSEMREYAQRP